MIPLISNVEFQTVALAWIGTGVIVVSALVVGLLKVMPEIKALWNALSEMQATKAEKLPAWTAPPPQAVPPSRVTTQEEQLEGLK